MYKRLMRQSRTHPLACPKERQVKEVGRKLEEVISQRKMQPKHCGIAFARTKPPIEMCSAIATSSPRVNTKTLQGHMTV
jgi:hypothetical protein